MLFQGFKHIVFFYLFFKQMSSSVESDQSDRSCSFDTPMPSTSKSTRERLSAWDSFTFSSPPELKSGKKISDQERNLIIREAYAGMRAQRQSGKIRSEDYIVVARKICEAVPQLRDKPPPGSKCSFGHFVYWVCSFTIISPYLHITHYILWLYHSSDLFNNLLFVISEDCP